MYIPLHHVPKSDANMEGIFINVVAIVRLVGYFCPHVLYDVR